jgi:hypothetical protein
MKGDFSRSTFDPLKHYTSVRMQQGRVQLDADWNEQIDILLHLIKTQLADLLGPGATVATEPGFAITLVVPGEEPENQTEKDQLEEPPAPARTLPDFQIGAGRYYVEGILCENEAPVLFSQQPDYPAAASLVQEVVDHDQYLVYLDVWQRHITAIEDPAIREIALGGPDTTTRVKTVWQVKLLPLSADLAANQSSLERGGLRSLTGWQEFVAKTGQKRLLKARMDPSKAAVLENRLYRVEIHSVANDQATFKWSRENGSVVLPITSKNLSKAGEDTLRVNVDDLGRDPYQLQEGFWVELVDDVTVLNGHPLPLCQVTTLDRTSGSVKLHAEKDRIDQILSEIGERELQHPLLRRWENDVKPVVRQENATGNDAQGWIDLENGIQIAFSDSGTCQIGDYWLIPARTRLNEGIEWPQKDGLPLTQAPYGIPHHYAPLALIKFQAGRWTVDTQETAAVRSLPQITADFSSIDRHLQDVLESLNQVKETVETLAPQAHMFETVQSQESLEKGDLVSLDRDAVEGMDANDPDMDLPVKLASAKDRGMVIGVVWESIDEEQDGKRYRIVLHGRVRCKVIGRVEPGDLLVPSNVPGFAKKAGWYHQPGTIVGKALSFTTFEPEAAEEIEEGTRQVVYSLEQQPGTVEMLVTLC